MTGAVYKYVIIFGGGDAGRLIQQQHICEREARKWAKQNICRIMGAGYYKGRSIDSG